jgi:hypothetical protein
MIVFLAWPPSQVTISDVERNGYVFSDGVGRISPALLTEVLAALPPSQRRGGANVCAVQVRPTHPCLHVLPRLLLAAGSLQSS